ncbi:MAG: hypothetical protein LBT00_15920 [Spirochaetaceae bacterium]|nr:hypothetical protein [Spirochaetaceae bacterium]
MSKGNPAGGRRANASCYPLDCFARSNERLARNDERVRVGSRGSWQSRHCERSAAIQREGLLRLNCFTNGNHVAAGSQ